MFGKLFGRSRKTVEFEGEIAPDEPLFVVADIHGRIDLLEKLLDKQPKGTQLIFLGDYIDRGEESAKVVARVMVETQKGAIALAGNHEVMLLDFLMEPTAKGARFMRFGGLQTLQSYGVSGISLHMSDEELLTARDTATDAIPAEQVDWLKSLPVQHQSGNIHIVHAGANPETPMNDQKRRHLIWGHKEFGKIARSDGQWVLRGHEIVDQPVISQGCVHFDLGSFATGRLAAAHVTAGAIEFIQA